MIFSEDLFTSSQVVKKTGRPHRPRKREEMASLNTFEMFLGQALVAAKVDMLRKRQAAKASMTLAKALLEKEMLAALNARLNGGR